MDDTQLEQRLEGLEQQNQQLATGVCALAALYCVLLGIWNLYQSLLIPKFKGVYDEMLNGKALPALTTLVVEAQTIHLAISAALPVAAIFIFLARRRSASSLWILLAIMLFTTCQLVVTRFAIWTPIYSIITEMSD